MNKVSFFSLVIASSCLSVSVSAKNLQDYVFPPLEQEPMNDSAEQKYKPNSYMSYSNHKNNSFFQQSDYIFPEIKKSVAVKPSLPSANDYSMTEVKKRKTIRTQSTSKYSQYPYTVPSYSNNKSAPKNNYQNKPVRATNYSSNSSYRYPSYPSTTTTNNMFDVNNWNPMNGKLPMFPGMGNSSMFNSTGMRMPNFF